MRIVVLIALVCGLAFAGTACAQPGSYQYKESYSKSVKSVPTVSPTWVAPAYPYSWGPYGNYGVNPYYGSMGYSYQYRQQFSVQPVPAFGYGYPQPYGYSRGFFFQFGRTWR